MKNQLFSLYTGIIVLYLLFPCISISQNISGNIISFSDADKNEFIINESNTERISFTNYLKDFHHITINSDEGLFSKILVDGYGFTSKTGYPEMAVNVKVIEIPLGADLIINIKKTEFTDYRLSDLGIDYPLYPHQPPVPKRADAQETFKINRKVYNTDSFYPFDIVSYEELGIMRQARLGRISISPVQYNPAKGVIRVYSKLEADIIFKNGDDNKTRALKRNTRSFFFNPVYNDIIKLKDNSSKDTITKYPIKYVIVSDPMFQSQLQDFIEWKTKKGFTVIEAYTDDPLVGGSADSIKNYLESLYYSATPSDPAQTFVLLVGDFAQIPAKNGQTGFQITDLYYAEYTGDFLPDAFIGRFSATNVDELQPQIDKTIEYEKYLFPNPSFLDNAVLIAGVDGTHGPIEGNGQLNYISDYYINTASGFNPYYYPYPASGTQGPNIIQNVSNGVGFVNYTAHGNVYGWQNPSFQVSDVATLANANKYPLMVGNACQTCNFGYNVCFGEALLRKEDGGAIGYIGATADSYWNEDYYWSVGFGAITANPTYAGTSLAAYDRAFHIFGEPESEWFVTQGQMLYGGNLAVMASGSSDWDYYWEIYHLLGDPSLMVYYTVPSAINVNHASMIPVGSNTFTVVTEPHAYVGISMNGVLHGAAPTDPNGIAVIDLVPFTQAGTADIVVTKQNRQPYIDTVTVDFPTGPYLIMNKLTIIDSSGNNNGEADPGELISLDLEIKNTGSSPSYQTSASISCADTNITILKDIEDWGDIPAFDSVTKYGAFVFEVNELITDQHHLFFNIQMEDTAGNSYKEILIIILNAPHLEIGNYFVDDQQSGNSNGRLDPGETADIIIPTFNNGHIDADNATGELLCNSGLINIINTTYDFNVLFSGTSQNAIFSVSVNTQVPVASYVELDYSVTSGVYKNHKSFFPFLGEVSEDWETGDFSRFNWQQGGNKPWVTTDVDPYEGDYCSRSGDIKDWEKSVLSISFEVSIDDSISFYRKVSSEEGYDFLRFYIDNDQVYLWSGSKDWARVCYPVKAGNRTFQWVYEKDFGTTAGDDAAWIDMINFPPVASSIGTEEMLTGSDKWDLNIFPNPAKEQITFSFIAAEECETTLNIYDSEGKKVKEINDLKNRQTNIYLDLFEFKAGAYYAVLNSCKKREIRKFLVIK